MHGTSPIRFFSKEEKAEILKAIQEAEANTSGEIRVHLIRSLKRGEDPMEAGKRIFERLGMTRTRLRNGVLFLLELKHHELVLLGDRGIHERVGGHFWEQVLGKVLEHFKEGEFAQGLAEGIRTCGDRLKEFFPYDRSDRNELPDEISHEGT
jgi:uncharacterized membrane protein